MSSSNRIDPSPKTSAATGESGVSTRSRATAMPNPVILGISSRPFSSQRWPSSGSTNRGGIRRCEQDPGGGEVPVAEAQPVRLVDGAGSVSTTSAAVRTGSGPPSRYSRRFSPFTYSEARNSAPS